MSAGCTIHDGSCIRLIFALQAAGVFHSPLRYECMSSHIQGAMQSFVRKPCFDILFIITIVFIIIISDLEHLSIGAHGGPHLLSRVVLFVRFLYRHEQTFQSAKLLL